MGARLKPFRFVAASGVAGWQLLNFNGLDPDHEPFLGSGDDDAWIGFLNVLHRICRLLVSEGVEAQNLGIGEFDREQMGCRGSRTNRACPRVAGYFADGVD
jgi:hypothetical protein